MDINDIFDFTALFHCRRYFMMSEVLYPIPASYLNDRRDCPGKFGRVMLEIILAI